uniref:IncF plasmid conjugative transfer pilus assembly protein TraK n=1 Tax=Klebsiella pneumoniae TaxID=573 RepID=A0A8B0SRS3_KLEPN|nr:IncF plasmid conjugative transfer pilus assembly protein TraK [Klebsiella pneumoniae]
MRYLPVFALQLDKLSVIPNNEKNPLAGLIFYAKTWATSYWGS